MMVEGRCAIPFFDIFGDVLNFCLSCCCDEFAFYKPSASPTCINLSVLCMCYIEP